MMTSDKFHAYYEGKSTQVGADRVSTEWETIATFDTLEDAKAYAKEHSTHTLKVYASQMTEFEWKNRRASVRHFSSTSLKTPEQSAVEQILSDSDIVWPKYGSDTIEALAKRIVDKLK